MKSIRWNAARNEMGNTGQGIRMTEGREGEGMQKKKENLKYQKKL